MATLLLIIIYIAFIGLGIPDSLMGTAWPAIYKDFNLPVSYQAFLTMTVTIGTILSSLFGSRVINKYGTKNVVVTSTFLTVIALIGYSLSPNLWVMLLFSIPNGFGAGAIDSALNNYVALHYDHKHMNFLHCFYGIGVTFSPYIMAFSLASDNNWRKGYLIAFFVQLGIAILLLVTSPLWNKVKTKENKEEVIPENLSYKKMFKTPLIICVGLFFLFSCSVEISTGVWSASFLVNAKGFNASDAAKFAGLFYFGLALGRFIAGLVSKYLSKFKLIFIGEAIIISGLVLLFIPNMNYLYAIALAMMGFGCGPIYPNMSAMTPEHYGAKYSQSIMGFQMAFAYIPSVTTIPLLGFVCQKLSFNIFPFYIILFAICLITTSITIYVMKKKNLKSID